MSEASFERKFCQWLRDHGAIVVKNRVGPGVPTGFPDRTAFYKGKYAILEFKKDRQAQYRPGQLGFLKQFARWNEFTFTVYPENADEVKQFFLDFFF